MSDEVKSSALRHFLAWPHFIPLLDNLSDWEGAELKLHDSHVIVALDITISHENFEYRISRVGDWPVELFIPAWLLCIFDDTSVPLVGIIH